MELLDCKKEKCKFSFKNEVKNMEFFELLEGMNLHACIDEKMREESLLLTRQ
jgi:hypothetical protein